MKKTLVTLLAASTLAATFVPAFANNTVSTSGDAGKGSAIVDARAAKAEAERKAKAVQPFVNAERIALANYNKALEAHNTVVERFQAALKEYEAAKIERDNVRRNAEADMNAAHAKLQKNLADNKTILAELEAKTFNVAGLQTAAQAAQTAAEAAANAVAAHKLTAPVDGSAEADVKAYNDELARLEKDAADKAAKAADAKAKYEAEDAAVLPTRRQIAEYKAIISDIEYKLATENIDNDAKVKVATANLNAASTKLGKVSAEMPDTRTNLDAAKAALDKAIEANKEAHYVNKLEYNAPEVAGVAAGAAAAEKKANEINGASAPGAAKPGANGVAAANTPTGQKTLPKTSAAK